MSHKISATELRKRLGDVLKRVALRHDAFIIERNGTPTAALIPLETLEELERAARRRLLGSLDAQPGIAPQREAGRVADDAKHASRSKKSRRG